MDVQGLVIGSVGIGVLLVVATLAWTRYLQHKETMKLAEMGGQARASLEARERWRLRWGILAGAAVTGLGLATAVVVTVALTWGTHGTYPLPPVLGREETLLLIAMAVFLLVMGLVTLGAYAVWSRRGVGRAAEGESEEDEPRERAG